MRQPDAGDDLSYPPAGRHTLEMMEAAVRYNRWVFERVRAGLGQRVLEIGCGTGTITRFLTDRQLVVGLDVVEEYLRVARARFSGYPNVIILRHDLSTSVEGLRGYGFDSALSVNVFEHIADDEAAMRGVCSLLDAGGRFAVLVPSHPRLLGDFDRTIGHHRRYTKADLHRKLEAAGFRVEWIRRSNPVGALGWLVTVKLLRQPRLQGVALYDRFVPMLAALDALAEFPVGLSLVAVARKA